MAAVCEVEQAIDAVFHRSLVEIDDLHLAVAEGHFREIHLRASGDPEVQCVAGVVDAEIGIHPIFAAEEGFAVLPHHAMTRRQHHHGAGPNDGRHVDDARGDDRGGTANDHGPRRTPQRMAYAQVDVDSYVSG